MLLGALGTTSSFLPWLAGWSAGWYRVDSNACRAVLCYICCRDKYEVVVVSPRNYFLYTPLLPAVAVGTMEERRWASTQPQDSTAGQQAATRGSRHASSWQRCRDAFVAHI